MRACKGAHADKISTAQTGSAVSPRSARQGLRLGKTGRQHMSNKTPPSSVTSCSDSKYVEICCRKHCSCGLASPCSLASRLPAVHSSQEEGVACCSVVTLQQNGLCQCLTRPAAARQRKRKEKEKTMSFGIDLLRSPVLYRAAQYSCEATQVSSSISVRFLLLAA